MTIKVGDSLVVDRDAVNPDLIAASSEMLTHRLLDKAASRGWAVDWTTTNIQVVNEGYGLADSESRVVIEAEMLR